MALAMTAVQQTFVSPKPQSINRRRRSRRITRRNRKTERERRQNGGVS